VLASSSVSGAVGVINPEAITITAAANTRTYDGTTSAAAAPTITSGSLMGGDTFTGLGETYSNKNAGTGKTLTVGYTALNDGNGGNNYTVTEVASNDGVITPASLLIAANDSAVLQGQPPQPFTASYIGLANGDSASDISGLTLSTPAPVPSLPVGTYAITPGGATAANYSISYADGTLAVADLPATVQSVSQNAMLNMPEIATSDQGSTNPIALPQGNAPTPEDASSVKPGNVAPSLATLQVTTKGLGNTSSTAPSTKPVTIMHGLLEVDPVLAKSLALNDTQKGTP
jgi:hypothetical protein